MEAHLRGESGCHQGSEQDLPGSEAQDPAEVRPLHAHEKGKRAMTRRLLFTLFVAALVALNACSKKEEAPKAETPPAPVPAPAAPPPPAPPAGVTAAGLALGNAIGADKKVTQPSETFGKKDTIYASVDTTGTGTATLKAKWTYHKGEKETVVKEDSQTI